jgi:hypothetical protein
MLIMCQSRAGKDLSLSALCSGETDQTYFSTLHRGDRYLAYGMKCLSKKIDFLIKPEDGVPIWVPSNLFRILDYRVPSNWQICITSESPEYTGLFNKFGISALLGYEALVTSFEHYEGIIDCKPKHLKRFALEVEAATRLSHTA